MIEDASLVQHVGLVCRCYCYSYFGCFPYLGVRWQKSKSNCLVGVWSMTIGLMMSNLVWFYLNIFVGGFWVDWCQIWKNKRLRKDFLVWHWHMGLLDFCQVRNSSQSQNKRKCKTENESKNDRNNFLNHITKFTYWRVALIIILLQSDRGMGQ